LDRNIRVLDFGCGVARPLLHFTREYPAPSYYACDVDDSAVAFIRKEYPQVQASVNRFKPPLTFDAGFFDIVYSVSIFSHLTIKDQADWLRELARVTKPGGLCLLTTAGRRSLQIRSQHMGMDEVETSERLAKDGYFFKEYEDWRENAQHQATLRKTSLNVGIEGTYGMTIVAPEFIHREWPAAGFEVRAVVEGAADGQDIAVLKRL
jgi:SAM-dependent methyltransferase